ncbi:lipopolysaccharide biosynthesis protein [Oleiphilus sp. HI0080]|uniref:lipopolysaccharide biosynthesis protein n=1 Tax=Oleiphilus sp. HI0080 TaxID=1822255 RepID=UPI000838EFD7|nr:oligosaccharide flippase family protein [Oleiphilus sp. HI0080]
MPNSTMLSHSAIYAIGNIAQKIVSIIMLPIYTQVLSPADYGAVGLITFFIGLVDITLGAKLTQAVPKYFHDYSTLREKNSVVFTGFSTTLLAGIIATLLVFFSREVTADYLFESSDFAIIIGLFSLLIVNQSAEYNALTYIRLLERPWLFTAISIAKLITQLTLNIYFVVYLELGVLGVAYSAAISSSCFALGLTLFTLSKTGIGFDRDIAIKMFKFCWPLWIGAFAALYYGSSNRYFMSEFSTLDDIGFFELAVKLTMIMSILIWQPFSLIWQSERFKIYKMPNAQEIYKKIFTYISSVLLVAALSTSLFALPVIDIMASDEFRPATKVVPILALTVVLTSLNFFFNFSFFATETTKIISRNNYISAAFITIPLLLLIPEFGYIGAAFAALIGGVFQLTLTVYSGKQKFDMGVTWKYFFLVLVICLTAVLIDLVFLDNLSLVTAVACKTLLLSVSVLVVLIAIRTDSIIRVETNNLFNRLFKKLKVN